MKLTTETQVIMDPGALRFAVDWQGNRRDTCYAVGVKMLELDAGQSARAWASLGRAMERLGDKDVPKFMDLLANINAAAMVGGSRKAP